MSLRLRGNFENGKPSGGRIEYVTIFFIVAVFVLVIACINFMNLATARSEKRAKEVGVRKVLGAGKKTLIGQFIGEAVFMAALSVIAGLVIIALVLPIFNTLVQKQLEAQPGPFDPTGGGISRYCLGQSLLDHVFAVKGRADHARAIAVQARTQFCDQPA